MITQKNIELVRGNWLMASKYFNFKILTPFEVEINNRLIDLFAFLPDFGSPNGMIICLTSPPEYDIDQDIVNWAVKQCYFYSFINIENYLVYNETFFQEAMDDWGRKNI